MSFGYLGELTNRNLNDVRHGEGFYEVLDPNIVSSFNNYPDDSNILYKLLYQVNDLNQKYAIFKGIQNYITQDKANRIRERHESSYKHMSGTGSKVITGILEVYVTTSLEPPVVVYNEPDNHNEDHRENNQNNSGQNNRSEDRIEEDPHRDRPDDYRDRDFVDREYGRDYIDDDYRDADRYRDKPDREIIPDQNNGKQGNIVEQSHTYNENGVACIQKFYRVTDNVTFQRMLIDNSWTEWFYIYDSTTEHLQIAEDICVNKTIDDLNRAFRHYAPPYDDGRIRGEISRKVPAGEYNNKLHKNPYDGTGTMILAGKWDWNQLRIQNGPLIIDTGGRTNGDGSFIHAKTNSNHYQQLFRSYDGPCLGIGHNGLSQVYFDTAGRYASSVYPSNVYWNYGGNSDYEIQHLGRLRFNLMSGSWRRSSPSNHNIMLDDVEDFMITYEPAQGTARSCGSFILPACCREHMEIYPSVPNAGVKIGDYYSGNEVRLIIDWGNNVIAVNPDYLSYWLYCR